VFAALEAGARGYLTKDANASEIQTAIHAVRAGEALLDTSVQRRLLERTCAPMITSAAVSVFPG
jgi:DNA-binding NarL/FixJ family response regulator